MLWGIYPNISEESNSREGKAPTKKKKGLKAEAERSQSRTFYFCTLSTPCAAFFRQLRTHSRRTGTFLISADFGETCGERQAILMAISSLLWRSIHHEVCHELTLARRE